MRNSIRPVFRGVVQLSTALLIAGAAYGAGPTDPIRDYFQSLWESGRYPACVAVASDALEPAIHCFGQDALGRPLTADSRLQLASVSKQFTAVLALRLAEEDLVDLDVPIGEVLPELRRFPGVTLRHLLTNTGGIPNHDRFPRYDAGHQGPIADAELLSMVDAEGPRFRPGESYEYSNFGWRLAALILERAARRPFATVMDETLLRPHGLHDSSAMTGQTWPDHPGLEMLGSDGVTASLAAHPDWNEGAGTMISTARDMVRWLRELHGGRILTAESYALLTTAEKNGYAMGLSVYTVGGARIIGHDGRFVGGSSDVRYRSSDGFLSVVLSPLNTTLTHDTRSALARFVSGEPMGDPEALLTAAGSDGCVPDVHALQGTYPFGPDFFVRVRAVGGRLQVAGNWGDFTELTPLTCTRFLSRSLGAEVVFSREDGGNSALSWNGSPAFPRLLSLP